ncbi:hypothetical protein BN1723_014885 [Verticillium longisporum]|uniref:Uncharacterized protein n=1 Tax=Verticillium longisporum TaxID=100787 RepID=A0A0G4MKM9_VERLO|nr:hypothetical protein BN1723_014885 [Verticillium longisporum]
MVLYVLRNSSQKWPSYAYLPDDASPSRVELLVVRSDIDHESLLPALRRVLPVKNSGPTATIRGCLTPMLPMRDGRVLVMTAVRAPRRIATSRAPMTNGVRPEAEIPMTVSCEVKQRSSILAAPSSKRSSAPSTASSTAPVPPATTARNCSRSTEKVTGSSAQSIWATRPLFPAPT